ncbi:hypothetical protein IJG73_02695 [Candidatus Saccharibacteria bacterium]|nr:hypothetical protein [Candidatus Saccharibacteria bacterium]
MKITEKVKIAVAVLAVMAMSVVALPAGVAHADTKATLDKKTAQSYFNGNTDDKQLMNTLNTIINVAIGLIGFIAVVVIILGGVQYTTSAGDAGKVKKAKDTIMYGIIGLVIALLAFAIVNFILGNVFA